MGPPAPCASLGSWRALPPRPPYLSVAADHLVLVRDQPDVGGYPDCLFPHHRRQTSVPDVTIALSFRAWRLERVECRRAVLDYRSGECRDRPGFLLRRLSPECT